jgi:hypothetical protein
MLLFFDQGHSIIVIGGSVSYVARGSKQPQHRSLQACCSFNLENPPTTSAPPRWCYGITAWYHTTTPFKAAVSNTENLRVIGCIARFLVEHGLAVPVLSGICVKCTVIGGCIDDLATGKPKLIVFNLYDYRTGGSSMQNRNETLNTISWSHRSNPMDVVLRISEHHGRLVT